MDDLEVASPKTPKLRTALIEGRGRDLAHNISDDFLQLMLYQVPAPC